MTIMDVKTTTQAVRTGSIGWMLKRLSSRLDGDMNARLAPLGLELTSFAVMMTVLEHSPLNQAAISARLGMPAYKVSRALDHLERQGYIARHPDPTSRRAHVIDPTEAGLGIAPDLHAVVAAANAHLSDGLSAQETAHLIALLTRMVEAQAAREAAPA